MTRVLRLASIPGDGIGPDVVAEARRVLEAAVDDPDVRVEWTEYDLGAARWLATGETLPDSVLAEIATHDAILLGAVGDPAVAPGVLERGILLRLRFELDHYVNLRPARLYPGVPTPLVGRDTGDIDLVVVREGTEGPYLGAGGSLRPGTIHEVATEESYHTAYGVERVVRHAFELAAARPAHRLTVVHKTNVFAHAGALWRRIATTMAPDYPVVRLDYCHVDAAAMYLVTDPARFDVIVTDNLFGDILTDIAAAVAGGIGLAASASLDPSGAHPSMFEPVHGSAPDLAGTGRADPTAAILSAALLLRHLGLPAAGDRVEAAVAADLLWRAEPADLGSSMSRRRTTGEIGEAIAALVAGTST